jgi:ribose transport system substrate-binding protein
MERQNPTMTGDAKTFDKLTTFERRQRILHFLEQRPGVRVSQMADLLGVSEGTVRNDLRALAEGRQLTRVRGGAVAQTNYATRSAGFAARARVNEGAKQLIARWTADLIQDGDAILLDASSTVYHIAHFLQDRHNLTVITNGVEVAPLLARDPSNTVILLGGVLRPDGTSVTGLLSETLLRDLHVKTAFVSCSGFSVESGLTDVDIYEAQLKSKMLACADTVVALIDASKFGKVDFTPFARTDQVAHIFTDSTLAPAWIDAMRCTHTILTICDDQKAFSLNPALDDPCQPPEPVQRYKIGFANLSDDSPFALEVRRGLERAAEQAANIDLVLADNRLSTSVALEVANHLIASNIDVAIEFQIDQQANDLIMPRFRQANIPVIAVDIPMLGATFFGADNYQAGHMAGVAAGRWIKKHWAGPCDRVVVLEEPRAGMVPAARLRGQLEGLRSIMGDIPATKVIHLDCSNRSDVAEVRIGNLLQELSGHRLVFLSINDECAIGALNAARKAGRESDIIAVGQNGSRRARSELRRPGSRLVATTAYRPETYGPQLVDLAVKILRQEPVPPAVYVEHMLLDADNVDKYYPND